MNPDDIEALFRFKGGHSMARAAANPDATIRSWKTSLHGRSAWPERVNTEKAGIRFTNASTGDDRLITWAQISSHALEHTPGDVRALIRDIDAEWCDVMSMPDVPPGQWRHHTTEEEARLATCKRWLEHLARIVWDPELVRTEPEQLDMLAYLEEMTA